MRSHLQGCSLKLQTVKSHQAMAEAMQSTAKAMGKMNKVIDIPTITKMMADFERENQRTEMMQEVMGDAIDDALEGDTNEEDEERIVSQVLDEIGISFGSELPSAVTAQPLQESAAGSDKVATLAGGDAALNELEARLNNLKR
jgi:charged multivesicular body protein 2A